MKKILFLICTCFFLTGCQVDYELHFNEDGIEEKIVSQFDYDIYEVAEGIKDSDAFYIEEILTGEKIQSLIEGEGYYQKEIKVSDKKTNSTLTYKYTYDNFEKSYLLDKCFEDKTFINDSNYYYISLDGDFSCFSNSNMKIKVTTDRKVIYHNADEIKDGNYIWNLDATKDKYNVIFQVSKIIEAQEEVKKEKINIFPLIGLIFFAIAFLMIFLFKRKINNEE